MAFEINTVPFRRNAFLKQPAQVFIADEGTALPSDLLTTTTGKLTLNEQVITLPDDTSGGTFTLSYNGQTTDALAYNAAASALATALNGLSTLGSGQVSVSGSAGGPWTVGFPGSIGQDGQVYLIESDGSSLTGGTGDPTVAFLREHVGWTEGETLVAISEGFNDVRVNEAYGVVDDIRNEETGTITTTLAEGTLKRLYQAFSAVAYSITEAGGGAPGYEKAGFGTGTDRGPKQVLLYSLNRQGYGVLWVLHSVRISGDGGPRFQRGTKSMIPFKGTLLEDSTQAVGYRLCTMYNITAPAVS